jgi:hypothetical protein
MRTVKVITEKQQAVVGGGCVVRDILEAACAHDLAFGNLVKHISKDV